MPSRASRQKRRETNERGCAPPSAETRRGARPCRDATSLDARLRDEQ
jgi:hypothetical protein